MTDSSDEIEICPNVGPHELSTSIKSKAVVKFSAVQVPVKFNRLECNTDLNLPPSNWLTTSDSSYGLHKALYHSSGFPSFRMAHMFPDCVGEVDVVSDAENIKKLLKLPYSRKSAISMMVHKVGNTLLLDEFDIQKYLLRKADDDWRWLRTFILETIVSYRGNEHNFCLKDKSREAIQTKNLLSKFLYHSLKQSAADGSKSPKPQNAPQAESKPLPILGPVLPEPKIDENVPDPNSSHDFNRNVVWTFEDIRMLIGTDMPIFGGPNRPCISLRLRDMAKPINVLTGIDYWLDNLMCNVPEVVMCYHLDGIVQKYEIIKTEDLPYLENSQFAPQVVRNVAQNILAFLKAKATKAGHTYWLFKGRNDDVVKLYDLTTLCKNQSNCDPKHGNPFTIPVAMLLYTVARNMKNTSPKVSAKKAGSIKALLDNCIKLLPKEKYPQIVTSSHYILSDLHIPAGIDPKSPKFDTSDQDSDMQSVYEDDDYDPFEDDILDESGNVAVKNICDTLKELHLEDSTKQGRPPSPLIATVEERCRIALEHISDGISCLQYFNSNEEQFIKESEERAKDEEKMRILHEEQNPNMAKPFRPIPLPYESLCPSPREVSPVNQSPLPAPKGKGNKSKKKKLRKAKSKEAKDDVPSTSTATSAPAAPAGQADDVTSKKIAVNFNSTLFGSWNVHLKLLLLEKACLSYATLAEHNYLEQKFGFCLKHIYMAYRCQEVVIKYMTTMVSQKSCLLGRAGDCFLQIAKGGEMLDEYLNQYASESVVDANILSEIEPDLKHIAKDIIEPTKNVEQLMIASCKCYETALFCYEDGNAQNELLRRLGNVRNELGLKYMYWAQEEFASYVEAQKTDDDDSNASDSPVTKARRDKIYEHLASKSYDCLQRGILAFSVVQDNVNLAFLYCNMGRFMRFKAHLFLTDEPSNYLQKQKTLYQDAFKYYEKAKNVLGSRKCNPELWDLVGWELSTAMFTLTKQLQDYGTPCSPELEKEVLDLLQTSLKLCDTESPGARQVLYTYRSGVLHKRIASFYYSHIRAHFVDITAVPKTSLQLCKLHYEKAANILDGLKEASDYLIVQLERISLQEFLSDISTNLNHKIKNMQTALEMCLQTKVVFQYALSTAIETPQLPEFHRHLLLFESRLQNSLKTLIKLLLSGRDPRRMADCYKKMYKETLKAKAPTPDENDSLTTYLLNLVNKLIQIESEHL